MHHALRPPRPRRGGRRLSSSRRGSELLQDNRVLYDAKAELEQALSLQPSDPKGKGSPRASSTSGWGSYPRAIAIYEQLIQLHPDALEPRINLALSYLKTGQPAQARFSSWRRWSSRAWPQPRLGPWTASLPFQRPATTSAPATRSQAGGHDGMARRLMRYMAASGGPSSPSGPASLPAPAKAEMRRAAGDDALAEMDRGDAPFRTDGAADGRALAAPRRARRATMNGPRSGTAADCGAPAARGRRARATGRPRRRRHPPSLAPAAGGSVHCVRRGSSPRRCQLTSARHTRTAAGAAACRPSPRCRATRSSCSRAICRSRCTPSGVGAGAGYCERTSPRGIEAVRSLSYGEATPAEHRAPAARARAGARRAARRAVVKATLVELTGQVELLLGAGGGQRLWFISARREEALYLREDALTE